MLHTDSGTPHSTDVISWLIMRTQPILRTLPPKTSFAPCLIVSFVLGLPDCDGDSHLARYRFGRKYRGTEFSYFIASKSDCSPVHGSSNRLAPMVCGCPSGLFRFCDPHLVTPFVELPPWHDCGRRRARDQSYSPH